MSPRTSNVVNEEDDTVDMSRIFEGIRSRARSGGKGRRRPIAFVLPGGGVLGAIQVGHLEALLRSGISPDMIVGTSVGALNGAALAARPTIEGVECLRDVWLSLGAEDIFPGSRASRVWRILRKGDHLHPNDGIRNLIKRIDVRSFEHLEVPLSICAANLHSGEEHWFDEGPLAPAILASTAIPGVFPPVNVDGKTFVDGGVVNNVPISRAVELGAATIYVLPCGKAAPTVRPMKNPLDVLVQSFAHSRATRVELDRERFAGKATIIEMPVVDTTGIAYNDASQTERLYREAFERSAAFLAADAPVNA